MIDYFRYSQQDLLSSDKMFVMIFIIHLNMP